MQKIWETRKRVLTEGVLTEGPISTVLVDGCFFHFALRRVLFWLFETRYSAGSFMLSSSMHVDLLSPKTTAP